MLRRTPIFALAAAILAFATLRGQVSIPQRPRPAAPKEESPKTNLRISTNLVLVPVSVCDPTNRPVTGLEKEHFKLFDDHVEQAVTHFAMDDEPVAVGVLFDISGSMGPKLRVSRLAVAQFLRTANPEDDFFLVEFNDQPRLVVPLTRDVEEIQNQLTFAQSKGRTALLDALVLAMHEMKKSKKNRKALLIISDGGDNSSRYSEPEVRKMVRENDVLIYAIGVFEPYGGRSRTPEEASGPGLLNDISEQTGGRHFPTDVNGTARHRCEDRRGAAQSLRAGLLALDPQRDGRYHKVEVKVVPPRGLGIPKLSARWRLGYFAPSD